MSYGGKIYNKEVEIESKGEENGEKEEKDETKGYGGQTKRQTTKKQTKCYFYENRKCMKEN